MFWKMANEEITVFNGPHEIIYSARIALPTLVERTPLRDVIKRMAMKVKKRSSTDDITVTVDADDDDDGGSVYCYCEDSRVWAGDIKVYAHTERSGLLALRAAYAAIIDDMEDENGK